MSNLVNAFDFENVRITHSHELFLVEQLRRCQAITRRCYSC
jgi:hypothetical protein